MPWKKTQDPYRIWISEVILQQTRVAQGRNYYLNFIDRFPDVRSLAEAKQEEVLKMWEGLGYYSRARNLHYAAQQIMADFDCEFPTNYVDILSLKGIGNYTAAAISSFAFNLEYAVVDGNVIRVLSRYFGLFTPYDTGPGKKEFEHLAQKLISGQTPSIYNQAIMDFGALVCTPKKASCMDCSMNRSCKAYSDGLVYELPVKSKKTKVNTRYVYYLLCRSGEFTVISQRAQRGIWAGLFEFPCLETNEKHSKQKIKDHFGLSKTEPLEEVSTIEHKLTHLKLYISIFKLDFIPEQFTSEDFQLQKVEELHKFAFPKPIKSLIDSNVII